MMMMVMVIMMMMMVDGDYDDNIKEQLYYDKQQLEQYENKGNG